MKPLAIVGIGGLFLVGAAFAGFTFLSNNEPDKPTATDIARQTEKAILENAPTAEIYMKAKTFHDEGKFDQALRYWRVAADRGDATSALALGMLYDPVLAHREFSPFENPDPESAREWYERALQSGDQRAGSRLADLEAWETDPAGFQVGTLQRTGIVDVPDDPMVGAVSRPLEPDTRSMEVIKAKVTSRRVIRGATGGAHRTPLLQEGKSHVFKKILTRGSVSLRRAATMDGVKEAASLPPLTMLYVYDQQQNDDGTWLEVGQDLVGSKTGWLPGERAIPWRQSLVLTFNPRADRPQSLFFRTREDAKSVAGAVDPKRAAEELRKGFCRGLPQAQDLVSAIEPSTRIDINENFYFLPILDFSPIDVLRRSTLALNVAAASLADSPDREKVAPAAACAAATEVVARAVASETRPQSPVQPRTTKDFRIGIAFVVDTTRSMGPYIDRVRQAVRETYAHIRGTTYGPQTGFGLVAFRDSTEKVAGLDYVSKVVAPLTDGLNDEHFFDLVSQLEETKVNSAGFNEDSFQGVMTAIDNLDWESYDARFIVLVTDASSRDADDTASGTGKKAAEIANLADKKGIAIAVAHLTTPQGIKDHEKARTQYESLSYHKSSDRTIYTEAKNGEIEAFTYRITTSLERIIEAAHYAHAGKPTPLEGTETEYEKSILLAGRAMQLAFFGKLGDTKVPDVFDAWLVEQSLAIPRVQNVEVRLLITKDQLSALQESLLEIIESADRSLVDENNFFRQLRSAAALLSRNPDRLSGGEINQLADVGGIGDLLDGLPYNSAVAAISEEAWNAKSVSQQIRLIDTLKRKLRLYERIHDDTALWVAPSANTGSGNHLYPILLEDLP